MLIALTYAGKIHLTNSLNFTRDFFLKLWLFKSQKNQKYETCAIAVLSKILAGMVLVYQKSNKGVYSF